MFDSFKKKQDQKCIFVIGTGRSGTHWLGYILDGHKEIKATIEDLKIFQLVTQMALDFLRKDVLFPPLIRLYRKQLAKAQPFHYVDKSHPNIWFADRLLDELPNSYFIGVIRNPYATVSSMLMHKGVRNWCERWEDHPIPNPFLGISENNLEEYRRFSITAKCAARWVAHYKQMEKLKALIPNDRLIIMSYEKLIMETSKEVKKIFSYLNLPPLSSYTEVKKSSLEKWKQNLTKKDIVDVDHILACANINWENGYIEQTDI
jgi:hypothetical protein